ncbi:MAG: dihydrofolate reductase, partial [Buchnera aphidicola]|nr:dihydrofolate reductase [Buchnera aphidicola]
KNGVIWARSISNAILLADYNKEIMVIGGEKIYKQMMFYANKLYLTHIDKNIIGDTYFPKYQLFSSWKVLFKKSIEKKFQNDYKYHFEILS